MVKNLKKKNHIVNYSSSFSLQAIFRTITWALFLPLFYFLGKNWLESDILGNIHHFILRREKNFCQYFIGGNIKEKNQLLTYAVCFVVAIIILNILSIIVNWYLWKKDRYIENNNFYLHHWSVFIINILIHIASALLLTFSFVSALTVILALLFITFNSWNFFFRKKSQTPQLETFFSWKNQYIRKILFYSAIIILVVPLIIGSFQSFHERATGGSPEGFAKVYQSVINSSAAIRTIMEALTKTNYSLFHWVVLAWFATEIVKGRMGEFSDFWTKVNGIEKKVINFQHYYYYQESWAIANHKSVNLGDYSYIENSPNFLSKGYLEKDSDVDGFAQQNQKTVKYIEFCAEQIKEPAEKNYLNYCLFNEFSSWDDCVHTKELIKRARKK